MPFDRIRDLIEPLDVSSIFQQSDAFANTSPEHEKRLYAYWRCDLRSSYFAVAVFVAGRSNWALAQDHTINRTVKGQAGKDIRVSVYTNIQPDCTSGPL